MPDTPQFTGAPWTTEPGAIVFIDEPKTGFTDEEIARLFTGTATLTAAGPDEAHTGAMIALVPTSEDMFELVLPDGEPIEQLHTTLYFLGEADDITDDEQEAIHAAVADLALRQPAVAGDIFGFSIWNPAGPDPCLVADVNGDELADCFESVTAALDDVEFEYPEQHEPWRPHITLKYRTLDIPVEVLAKTGPITYDRLRVAFGGVATDYPLGGKIV